MSDQLQQLYDRGITGLNLEPGDSLCYWAHGEILRLRAEKAAAKERMEMMTGALQTANRIIGQQADEAKGLSDQLATLRAEVEALKEFEAWVQGFGDYRKAFSNRAARDAARIKET